MKNLIKLRDFLFSISIPMFIIGILLMELNYVNIGFPIMFSFLIIAIISLEY